MYFCLYIYVCMYVHGVPQAVSAVVKEKCGSVSNVFVCVYIDVCTWAMEATMNEKMDL